MIWTIHLIPVFSVEFGDCFWLFDIAYIYIQSSEVIGSVIKPLDQEFEDFSWYLKNHCVICYINLQNF